MSRGNIKKSGSEPRLGIRPADHEDIAVSFRYLTTKKEYNFDHFGKNDGDRKKAKIDLVDRLLEITSSTWLDMQNLNKETGFETLDCEAIRFSPNGYVFSKEEKVYVLRMAHKYRIIGFKRDNVYYVIGFDFNFSAYDHGH